VRYTGQVSARFLDDAARRAFDEAIASIERASAVEVVVAVRRQSAGYRHANAIVGAAIGFAALAAMLFSSSPFSLAAILLDPFLAALTAGALVELVPAIKRGLTPAAVRHHHVMRAARATFVERGVHNTRGRSGLLVYISWLEQQIVLVPDRGVLAASAPGAVARAEAALTAAMRSGGAAVARALEPLATELGTAMPRGSDDANELPDAIDSDLARRRFR
jgi:putative membrane protein